MNYTIYRLGDICYFTKGISPTLNTEPGEYPLVVTAAYRRSANTYQLEGPAVCIPLISSTGHGDAALHRVHYQEGRFALANLLVALTPKIDGVYESKYLYHLFMTRKDQFFVPLMQGTANVSLKIQDITSVEIPLPPLEEQRHIVAHIDALAEQIAAARGLRQGAVEEIDSIVSSIHLALAGERMLALGEFLQLDERQEPINPSVSYPQVGVRGFGQGLFPKSAVLGSETTYRVFNRLYAGAVVLSQVKGWEGAIGVCPDVLDGCYVSPEYRTFSCIEGKAAPEYLSILFPCSWFWEKLKFLSRGLGGRRERIRPEFFLNLKIPMPTIDAQVRAVETLTELQSLKHLQAETAAELDALLPSLLDRAFRGEL